MKIPKEARNLVEKQPLLYLATVDPAGWPNVVPMLQYWWYSETVLVVGDVFMRQTIVNVKATGLTSFSLTNPEGTVSYKFKGHASYRTKGPEYEFANDSWHEKNPGKDFKGCVVIEVVAVYEAKRGKTAGDLLAGEQV